jgi:osmotically-inducible protein OsmY
MMPDHTAHADDRHRAEAIAAFIARTSAGDVRVSFSEGVASLRGSVPTSTARAALEDLVSAHDGVEAVVNELVVEPAAVARPRPPG